MRQLQDIIRHNQQIEVSRHASGRMPSGVGLLTGHLIDVIMIIDGRCPYGTGCSLGESFLCRITEADLASVYGIYRPGVIKCRPTVSPSCR